MVVLRAVCIVLLESPEERFMKFCIPGYVARAAFVERKPNILPAAIHQLPSRNEGEPFFRKMSVIYHQHYLSREATVSRQTYP